YLHKLAVRRTHAGRGVSSALIEACRHAARTQGCAKLRLDCHPNLRGLYERLGFTHVDTFNPGWDPTFIAARLELEI
ncbi:GNAT family N-acetyltransferase, partial [Acinetobacter baumannii]|nr:GNAT family N-acetyltransferase [Acinetobacter baumannii]